MADNNKINGCDSVIESMYVYNMSLFCLFPAF